MINIVIKENITPNIKELVELYNDAGWINYTNNCNQLKTAFDNSLNVISAWDSQRLVGLIRVVGDGCTIVYIQDILVLKEYQRQTIGTKLMKQLLLKYVDVRQKVLMTDNQPETIAFYRSNGFVPTEEYNGVAFVSYNINK